MDRLPGKTDNFRDSVLCGSEPVDEETIESIKAKEADILKKLAESKTEKKKMKASLNVQRERIVSKLKSDYEDLQKTLREVQAERDRFEKELARQKEVVRYSAKQLIAGDKESAPVTEVLQLIQECLSSDSLHVPKPVQTQPVALELINGVRRLQEDIKKLREENTSLSDQKHNKIQSLEEELKTSKQTLQKLEQQKKDVEDAYKKRSTY